jgi:hypothetical protein
MQSKRNGFSAGGLVLDAVGWCERDVTYADQAGKELQVF